MRISAAFSTDRLLHSASSHITFRRSRAYCKIQAEVQLQRRENTSSGLTRSLTCAPSLFSNKLLYYAEQTSLLCYMHLNCTQRSSDQQKKKKKKENHDVPTLRKAMERKHTHHNSSWPSCVTGLLVLCSCFEMRISGHL